MRARRAWQSRCWFEIASSLKAPRNDPLGANVNYNVLLVILRSLLSKLTRMPGEVRLVSLGFWNDIRHFLNQVHYRAQDTEQVNFLICQEVLENQKPDVPSIRVTFPKGCFFIQSLSLDCLPADRQG